MEPKLKWHACYMAAGANNTLPSSEIKSPLPPCSSHIQSAISFPGPNQCTKSNSSKQVMFFTIEYDEIRVILEK